MSSRLFIFYLEIPLILIFSLFLSKVALAVSSLFDGYLRLLEVFRLTGWVRYLSLEIVWMCFLLILSLILSIL